MKAIRHISQNVKLVNWNGNYVSSPLGCIYFSIYFRTTNIFSLSDLLLVLIGIEISPLLTVQSCSDTEVHLTHRHFHSVHWWIGDGACNYRLLYWVWLQRIKGQWEQGSSFLIFPREINITKRCARAPADHKAKVPSVKPPLASENQGNALVIWGGSGVLERKWQS